MEKNEMIAELEIKKEIIRKLYNEGGIGLIHIKYLSVANKLLDEGYLEFIENSYEDYIEVKLNYDEIVKGLIDSNTFEWQMFDLLRNGDVTCLRFDDIETAMGLYDDGFFSSFEYKGDECWRAEVDWNNIIEMFFDCRFNAKFLENN